MFELENKNLNELNDYMYLLVTEKSSNELKHIAFCLLAIDDAEENEDRKNQIKYWKDAISEFLKIKHILKESDSLMHDKLERLFLGKDSMDYCVQFYYGEITGRRLLGCTSKRSGKYTIVYNN